MIACKLHTGYLGQNHSQSKTRQQILFCITTQRGKKIPLLVRHTRSSGKPTEHRWCGSFHASPQQGRPMYYSRVWDCKAVAVRAEGQGGGEASPPDAVRPASQTSVGRRSVNFPGFGSVQDSDTCFSPRALLAAVAANMLKSLIFKMMCLLFFLFLVVVDP